MTDSRFKIQDCRKFIRARAPSVLRKSLFGNRLLTQVVFLHYLYGLRLGRVCQQLGIGLGAAMALLHRVASLFKGLPTPGQPSKAATNHERLRYTVGLRNRRQFVLFA